MSKHKKQAHVVWKCDYHIVWTPKYRFRILSGLVKDLVDHDIRMLSEWKDCEVIELNVQLDHIHLVVSIPPKVSVSEYMGTVKGKLAIKLFKSYPQLNRTDFYDLCKRMHILFVIISIFPNAAVPRRDKNTQHQLVPNVIQHEPHRRTDFVLAFFDFPAPADWLIVSFELSAVLNGRHGSAPAARPSAKGT